jgi:ornithine cyclodeaminase/alanine dehydrogenase-like protein (mu-crystallin family)
VRLKEGDGWEADEEKCREIRSGGAVTVWKSVGVGVQDVAIAECVVRRAEEMGAGVRVEGYDE